MRYTCTGLLLPHVCALLCPSQALAPADPHSEISLTVFAFDSCSLCLRELRGWPFPPFAAHACHMRPSRRETR